ncbi:MAG: phage head-tail connector protein [Peptococcaceae bacterium]|nr:phage head-tail connector protein [Peptococcaceae bacterium]
MIAALTDRIKIRLTEEETPSDEFLEELIITVSDRICLRLGVKSLPRVMESIAVEAALKAYRRQYYEGINKESIDGVSVSFISNILAEYAAEFEAYLRNEGTEKKVVRFI